MILMCYLTSLVQQSPRGSWLWVFLLSNSVTRCIFKNCAKLLSEWQQLLAKVVCYEAIRRIFFIYFILLEPFSLISKRFFSWKLLRSITELSGCLNNHFTAITVWKAGSILQTKSNSSCSLTAGKYSAGCEYQRRSPAVTPGVLV